MVEQGLERADEDEGNGLGTSLFQALVEQVDDADLDRLASLRTPIPDAPGYRQPRK